MLGVRKSDGNSQVCHCFVVTPLLQAVRVATITNGINILQTVEICLIIPSRRCKRVDHKARSHV